MTGGRGRGGRAAPEPSRRGRNGGGRGTAITVWLSEHPMPDCLAPLRRLARRFEERHPGYRVELTGHDFRELPRRLAAAAGRGDGPHLAEVYATSSQFARDLRGPDGARLFGPVERAVAGRTQILGEPVVLGDLEPAVRGYYSRGGELLSVPLTATTALLYSNADLLARAGLEPPATWEELRLACAAVARLSGGPPHGVSWPNHGWLFQQAVAEQGGLLADHGNGRSGRAATVDLTSPELLGYVDWWARLHRDGHYPPPGAAWDWAPGLDAFAAGRVAFTIGSSVAADAISGMGRAGGFAVGVHPLPRSGRGRPAGHPVSGQSFWLADRLEPAVRDGALAFLQFLLAPENAAAWHRLTGFLPVTRGAVRLLAGEGWFARRPDRFTATGQVRRSDGSPAALGAVLGDFAGIQAALTRAMDEVLLRRADPARRFAAAQCEAQELLDAYNAEARTRTPSARDVG